MHILRRKMHILRRKMHILRRKMTDNFLPRDISHSVLTYFEITSYISSNSISSSSDISSVISNLGASLQALSLATLSSKHF